MLTSSEYDIRGYVETALKYANRTQGNKQEVHHESVQELGQSSETAVWGPRAFPFTHPIRPLREDQYPVARAAGQEVEAKGTRSGAPDVVCGL